MAGNLMVGGKSLASSQYMPIPRLICFKLFRQAAWCVLALVAFKTGSHKLARMPMIAMVTGNQSAPWHGSSGVDIAMESVYRGWGECTRAYRPNFY